MRASRPSRSIFSFGLVVLLLALALPALGQIETITVTATGRQAQSQDVPISVTAFNAEALERQGVSDIRGLVSIAPSLNINSSNTEVSGTTIRLRGVGTTGNNAGLEGSVGVFLDGVYLSRPGIAFTSLVDIERIEILRGPQGTLFGRNTSAGAIDIKTRQPVFNETETRVELSYGNFNDVITTGILNLPVLDDALALRFSGTFQNNDGYLRSAFDGDPALGYPANVRSNDRDRHLIRGQALWQINDGAKLRVIADWFDGDERCCDSPIRDESALITNIFAGFGAANGLPSNGIGANFGNGALDDRSTNANRRRLNEQKQWGVSTDLTLDHAYGTATLISSYRKARGAQAGDDDFTSNDLIDTQRSPGENELFTSEVRVQGTWKWLDWLVGGYFLDETITTNGHLGLGNDYESYVDMVLQGLSFNPATGMPIITGTSMLTGVAPGSNFTNTVGDNVFSQDGRSYSLFTHNVVDVGQFFGMEDRLHFTGGFRYTWEQKDGSYGRGDANNAGCQGLIDSTLAGGGLNITTGPLAALNNTAAGLICFPFVSPATPEFDGSYEDDQPTGTVKLAFNVTEDVMTYASYSRGFKAGGFNLDSTAAIVNPLSAATITDGSYLVAGDPTFDSELVDAYEIGVRSDLLGNRVRANGTFFYYDIEDFQVLEFTGIQFVTENIDQVTVKGFEFESQAQVVDGLELRFSFVYADAEYGTKGCNFNPASPSLPDKVCGIQLTNAPPWTVNLGGVYTLPLVQASTVGLPEFMGGGDVMASFYLNWQWKDERRAGTTTGGVSAAPGGSEMPDARIQQASNTLDMRVSLHSEDYRWSIEGWGRNLTDTRTSSVLFAVPLRTGATGSFIDPPRMYGFTVRAVF